MIGKCGLRIKENSAGTFRRTIEGIAAVFPFGKDKENKCVQGYNNVGTLLTILQKLLGPLEIGKMRRGIRETTPRGGIFPTNWAGPSQISAAPMYAYMICQTCLLKGL